jgi:glycosyltransferase involved in cell wall biosynthesis
MRLSVVVPMFNEAFRLTEGLGAILRRLADRHPTAEVICVDDGSRDATAERARELLRTAGFPSGRVISFSSNRGKGAAVREGMRAATGEVRLFADVDNSTPIEELERLLPRVSTPRTIVIGSRGLEDSRVEIRQPLWRQTMGRTFNLLPRLVLGLPYADTQCGFKLFGAEAARVCFAEQTLERFAFDVELLWIAKLRGFPVHEVPVIWRNAGHSRVNPLVDSLRMARDVLKIRSRHPEGAA